MSLSSSFHGLLAQVSGGGDFALLPADLWALAPVLTLAIGALLVLVLDLVWSKSDAQRGVLQLIAYLTLGVGLVLGLAQWADLASRGSPWAQDVEMANAFGWSFKETWRHSSFSVLSSLLAQGITLLVLCFSTGWLRERDRQFFGEYHFLLLLFPLGISLMTAATNLILAFLGLEIFSIALYVLVGIRRGDARGNEAALKYFLLGAFGAAIFLYGAALIYAGETSGLSVTPTELGQSASIAAPRGLAAVGGGLLFAALLFKASVVPFQMWTPDVYEGAPTPITALMSTGTKAGAFLLMLSLLQFYPHEAYVLLPIVTIATIVIGNAGAIVQTNLKRLLAYSGIAHAGYLLVAVTAAVRGTQSLSASVTVPAVFFYLITYAITNLVAFGVLGYLERREERVITLEGLNGLARRNPWASAALALSMFSLAGIPPTAGFWGKYQVFAAAMSVGEYTVAIVGIVGSVIGLYYYLRIVVNLYFLEPQDERPVPVRGFAAPIGIAFSAALILLVGVAPNLLLNVFR